MATVATRTRLEFIGGLGFFLVVLAGLLWAGGHLLMWMTAANQLPVNHLLIQGEHRYLSRDEVRESVLELPEVGNFLTLEVDRVQQQLLSLPWVYQVSVRKQWPDTLRVYIVEQPVAALWNQDAMVNAHGEIFRAEHGELELVSLSGPDDEAGRVLEEYRSLQRFLQPRGYEIERVHLTPRRSWELTLTGGVRLILGRDDIETRLQRFIDVYPGIVGRERVAYLDLRYDTGLAVGWKQDEETDNDQERGTKSDRRA
ncbi:cell division protein FtsQ [Zobellella denitrificans]|jgi:cell division protein FtsQ|uniref:cell division protein FtsQ/DivIB n=1 Tax=Zobellella denitrificans TaxID=347534 RepID=UPI000B8C3135|nr:cell division protein FtsQ/DivIB [Zobellella denitrificans]OXS14672.1 cell division protein FtsQ [Zobellella denitrificans]